MHLASIRIDGDEFAGAVDREHAWVYRADAAFEDVPVGGTVLDIIRRWPSGPPPATAPAGARRWRLDEVDLRAPVPRPARNIFCVGKNYTDHAREFATSGFDSSQTGSANRPIIFTKAPSTVIGPHAVIPRHAGLTDALDYEAELGVVIGRPGRQITPQRAYDHVFGYTIVNDVTARDLQRDHQQWFIGKSLDGFCPMGPVIVPAGEVQPTRLTLRCWVNEELRQEATTADLIFDIPSLIASISAGITLETGDIIATGTPAGVGAGLNPPQFLQAGDRVTIEISGLGELSNVVGQAGDDDAGRALAAVSRHGHR